MLGWDKVAENVTDIAKRFIKNPKDQYKFKMAVLDKDGAVIKAVTSIIDSVNKTMQAESKSEHWIQYSWRPCFGFTTCAILVNNYILLSYFTWARPIEVPSEVWLLLASVLGVASYWRGRKKKGEGE